MPMLVSCFFPRGGLKGDDGIRGCCPPVKCVLEELYPSLLLCLPRSTGWYGIGNEGIQESGVEHHLVFGLCRNHLVVE